MTPSPASDVVEAEGHLIDSQLLNLIFDKVIERGGSFEVLHFDIGRTNEDFSRLKLRVSAESEAALQRLVEDLMPLGCHPVRDREAKVRPADKDGCAPEDFYSTTNQQTAVRHGRRWLEVERQRMDAVIVIDGDRAVCRKLREVRRGDLVVCGVDGIRVTPEFRERDRFGFAFMTNDISSERRVEVSVGKIALMMREVRQAGGRIAFVAGPVVVHTGGVEHFGELIRRGYVQVLLAGNALAVHDIEFALFGTSLGVDLAVGNPVQEGHQHHMRAINTIIRAGGIRPAVEQGVLASGVMYECVRHGVEFVLAGSIRDDGPLPDTMMDLIAAQDRYSAALTDVDLVLVLSSMLHGIGVGNMLPARVRVVCVDINPAVVTKLSDRGSSQTVGLVTDVGLFLHYLAQKLRDDTGA
jgi:arginine dihydrolase